MWSEIFAAIRWWLVLVALGAAATPLTFSLFRRLPDRGYAFVKMVGLLVVSYLFWLLGSLGFLGNNVGGILVALVGFLGLSIWIYRRGQRAEGEPETESESPGISLVQWLRENKSQVLITELLFALVFAFWVWVRAQNPAIAATEKPMEFAFLNAASRTPSLPPIDPWLSGFAISYYYFGYIMTSVLARLAAVSEPVAFNLGIAWLVAGTAVGAFGIVYNLVAAQSTRRSALILGLVAAVALPIAGNMEVVLEIMHGNNVGSAAFWQWLNVRDLNGPPTGTPRYDGSGWWWWRASRVINEHDLAGNVIEGLEPIIEFPGFSFVLGDMHPHVLALPFAFLSLAVAFLWWQRGDNGRLLSGAEWDKSDWSNRLQNLVRYLGLPLWAFTALVLGGLSFLNTWDVLIHLFIVLGAFLLVQWQKQGWHPRLLVQTSLMGLLLVIPAVLLYFPFYLGFRSQAGPPFLLPMLSRPTRLPHFLIIFTMPLWSITILVASLAIRQRFRHWRAGLMTAVLLVGTLLLLMLLLGWIVASGPEGSGRVLNLANQLGITLLPRPEGGTIFSWGGWGLTAVLALIPPILSARLTYPGVTLLLTALISLIVMVWIHRLPKRSATADPARSPLPFVLLLIATGALLTLGPEFLYLRDNFGVRLNTTFKFYYQAWVTFGVAALFALDYLWRKMRNAAVLATAGYGLALALSLAFPYFAIQSRAIEFRGPPTAEQRQPATLNGLAQLQRYNPDDYAAIMWLRENIEGTPVVLEALGGQYSPQGHGRVSASTGLPTILQWAGHQFQWRGSSTPEPAEREPVVTEIYSQPNWGNTAELLNRYNVEYIYYGNLEAETYGTAGREKFDNRLEVAYSNDSVKIYRWHPE